MSGGIIHIATAVPKYRHKQEDIVSFMIQAHGGSDEVARQLNVLYKRSGINERYSTLPDFNLKNEGLFFDNNNYPGLTQRLAHFQKEAIPLAGEACKECLNNQCLPEEVTHIITVSCTGLFTPGLEMELIKYLGLKNSVQRHPVNFVGCYAAIPALNLANMICQIDSKAKVLLVCVELCTLHFQNENTRDNFTANAIFSDGAAACLIAGKDAGLKPILNIGSHYSEVHARGEKDMSWIPSEKGFLMKLSSYVPQLIEQEIKTFITNATMRSKVSTNDLRWAFHPGGIQILHKLSSALELNEDALQHSYNVLNDYGNMSSPTVLFVLNDILGAGNNQDIFCSAFGPGLTFESILLHHV